TNVYGSITSSVATLTVTNSSSQTGFSVETMGSFNGTNGANPYGRLLEFDDGNLYGTTWSGGSSGRGMIFRMSLSGSLSGSYSFTGGMDGGNPAAGLTKGDDGRLYGTAVNGGTNDEGAVFAFDPATNSLTPLYSFTGGYDGGNPFAPLVKGIDGYFYGTSS